MSDCSLPRSDFQLRDAAARGETLSAEEWMRVRALKNIPRIDHERFERSTSPTIAELIALDRIGVPLKPFERLKIDSYDGDWTALEEEVQKELAKIPVGERARYIRTAPDHGWDCLGGIDADSVEYLYGGRLQYAENRTYTVSSESQDLDKHVNGDRDIGLQDEQRGGCTVKDAPNSLIVSEGEHEEEFSDMSSDSEDGGVLIPAGTDLSTAEILDDSDSDAYISSRSCSVVESLYNLSHKTLRKTSSYERLLSTYQATQTHQRQKPPKPSTLRYDEDPPINALGIDVREQDCLLHIDFIRTIWGGDRRLVPGCWQPTTDAFNKLGPIVVIHTMGDMYAPERPGQSFAILDLSGGTDWPMPGTVLPVYAEVECKKYKYFGQYKQERAPSGAVGEAIDSQSFERIPQVYRDYLAWRVWKYRNVNSRFAEALSTFSGPDYVNDRNLPEDLAMDVFHRMDAMGLGPMWITFKWVGYCNTLGKNLEEAFRKFQNEKGCAPFTLQRHVDFFMTTPGWFDGSAERG